MAAKLTLKDLAVKHNYYCNLGNYHSNDSLQEFESFDDFLEEYGDADIDYNLIFRWDVKEVEEDDEEDRSENHSGYFMEVFFMQQRRGHFVPSLIKEVTERDVPKIVKLLKKHRKYLNEIWAPL